MVQKKTSTKKSASGTARSSRAKASKKALARAEGDRCFWVHNGPVVCDLCGLGDAVKGMSISQFQHHTTGGKNDFAVWSAEIAGDPEVAARLRRAKTKEEAIRVLEDALESYDF